MAKYDRFTLETERETALGKLTTQLATLARIAQDGIEFHPSDLPRSFRVQTESAAHAHLA